MEIIVNESKSNRFWRIYYRLISLYLMIMGMIFSPLFIVMGIRDIFFLFFGLIIALPVMFVGYFYYEGISKIKVLRDDSMVLICGKKEIELSFKDILYIFKSIRFTLWFKRYSLVIRSKAKNSKRFYVIINEPGYNFLDIFRNTGIRLKNVP